MVNQEQKGTRQLNNRQTITDSKKAFHKAFPYVIPPIYRRLADELIVELNLLSHKRDYKPGVFTSLGLCNVFDVFTSGYRPESQLQTLFEAICKCNGFDPLAIRNESNKVIETITKYKLSEAIDWLKSQGSVAPVDMNIDNSSFTNEINNYSRLIPIGVQKMLECSQRDETHSTEHITKVTLEVLTELGLSNARVDKDLSLFRSNQEKLSQAMQLMKEIIESDRRKKNNPTFKTEGNPKQMETTPPTTETSMEIG